jgi:hypothetical protein
MQIRIEGRDLPGRSCGPSQDFAGYENIHVGVQRRGKPDEHLELQPGDADSVSWTFDATVRPGADVLGPYVQGGPGKRFIYLSWGTVDAQGFHMFRRAKIFLADVEPDVFTAAQRCGTLVIRLGLTDAKGHPACAWIKPPRFEAAAG